MSEHAASTNGIRFGRTVLDVVDGELADQRVDAIVYPANSRGVMGAGPAGSLPSAAGPEVEREAMAHAPLNLGGAIATSSGKLAERGVSVILHAAVIASIGEHSVPQSVYRGLDAALKLASDLKVRSLALPLLGASAEDPAAERRTLSEGIVDVIVKRLRQRGVRLERIVFVVRFEDDREMLQDVIQRARARVWTTSA
jgi:O-acetyl-ADP-ribose deacetylase (regulator of RNase III)